MMHLKVGYEIGKKLKVNKYKYYLGLLAPDTPNLYGFAPKNERWSAHIRKADLNEWRKSLKKFFKNNKNNYDKSFLLGYYIHILTDIVFDEFFYNQVKNTIIKANYKKEEAHKIMSEDMYNYYFKEYEEIKEILKSSNLCYNINGLTKEEIIKWKNKNINRLISINKSKYIKESIIKELINKVNEELYEKRNNNK